MLFIYMLAGDPSVLALKWAILTLEPIDNLDDGLGNRPICG
jgi:hypothetical protein